MLAPQTVRESTAKVMERAVHVRLADDACARLAQRILAEPAAASWDATDHFVGEARLTLRYLLVLDALNFCFWPDEGFEYGHLARALRVVIIDDPQAFDADRLIGLTASQLAAWLGRPLALLEERARLLRELGAVLAAEFDGDVAGLVAAAQGSAARLATLTARYLPGFRDHGLHRGHQVFFYKRAQIFAADVWGAFGGVGAGAFDDIAELTTFADYRLPQLLRAQGVLRLDRASAQRIDGRQEILAGDALEIELRAATVQAVERARDALGWLGRPHTAVEVDWWLWHHAEAAAEDLPPHHRTRSIYY
jgi:hypothetical protein